MSNSVTQLWDASALKLIRTMGGHQDRVVSLSWNTYILSSGSKTGQIIHHDVRVPEHCTATFSNHTQVSIFKPDFLMFLHYLGLVFYSFFRFLLNICLSCQHTFILWHLKHTCSLVECTSVTHNMHLYYSI